MTDGRGKPGYCKICVHPAGQFLNQKYEADTEGFNAAKAAAFAKELGLTFNRATWYSHVDHITHPLVTADTAARRSPVVIPKTNQGALEMIRNIGLKRAVEHPNEVTIDHGLKAATVLQASKTSTDAVLILISKVMSGEARAEEIVGEYTELPSIETQQQEEELPVG